MGNWFSCFHLKKSKNHHNSQHGDSLDYCDDIRASIEQAHHIERQSNSFDFIFFFFHIIETRNYTDFFHFPICFPEADELLSVSPVFDSTEMKNHSTHGGAAIATGSTRKSVFLTNGASNTLNDTNPSK